MSKRQEDVNQPVTESADGVQVRGGSMLSRIQYVVEQGDAGAMERVSARLPKALHRQIERGLVHDDWYPLDDFIALNRAIDGELGSGDGAMFAILGRHTARQMLSTIYGAFYQKGDPLFLFRQAQQVWDQYYSSGRVDAESRGDGVVFRIHDFAQPEREVCQTVAGWMEESILFAGGSEVEITERRCACRGDDFCELEAEWAGDSEVAIS